MKHIVIIGGGMSGMVAAINAAGPNTKVTLLERQDRIGKKILLTGNGRCNLSNQSIQASDYLTDDPQLLQRIIDTYRPLEKPFWDSLGLMTKEKNGCIYPLSGQASTVQNCLRLRLEEKRISVITGFMAEKIRHNNNQFYIETVNSTDQVKADVVILSCGGKAGVYEEQYKNGFELCRQLGHHIKPAYPALVQTFCEGNYFKSISGVRTDARISLLLNDVLIAQEEGELQLTDKGLSGIVVFQLTRYLGKALQEGKKAVFLINFIASLSKEQWHQNMQNRLNQLGDRTAEDFFSGILNKKLILMLLKECGIRPGQSIQSLSQKQFRTLLDLFQEFPVKITGLNDYAHAQISTGGVPLSEVDETLASKYVNNLYLTGELLDVSGACGGYNLYFAAATGYLAGQNSRKETTK